MYSINIGELSHKLAVPRYAHKDWRLFFGSSKQSLKCALLHNGNQYAFVPLAHSTTLKKYEAVKYVLEKVLYDQHERLICVDLKLMNFLFVQQVGVHHVPMLSVLMEQ